MLIYSFMFFVFTLFLSRRYFELGNGAVSGVHECLRSDLRRRDMGVLLADGSEGWIGTLLLWLVGAPRMCIPLVAWTWAGLWLRFLWMRYEMRDWLGREAWKGLIQHIAWKIGNCAMLG